MPSKSFEFFENKLLSDVDSLIATHAALSHDGRGRRHLGHLTRSGIVMLCAAWESYIERVVQEVLEKMVERSTISKDLPKAVLKHVANFVKNHKNELKVIELSGDGWIDVLRQVATEDTSKLNTPKSQQIQILFHRLAGVGDIWDGWSSTTIDEVNDFVSLRGAIAHKGSDAKYVKIAELKKHREQIARIAIDLDNQLASHIASLFPRPHKAPWRRRKI